jgi:predicted N-acetyltransferase YhbS
MGTAYAKLFAKENAENLLIVEEDGRPVTLVGLLPARLSIAGCTIPVVSMGAVCTDPAYRGRNYADILVKQSIAKCAENGAHLLLISGTRGLYQRNGSFEAGEVKRFTIESTDELQRLQLLAKSDVRSYDETRDIPAILSLMETEKAYFKRTAADLDLLIRSAAVLSNSKAEQHVWLSFTGNGEASGYIVFGLSIQDGISTAEVVEYAGCDEAVSGLLTCIFDRCNPQQLHIPVMAVRASLSERLASAGFMFTEITIPGTVRMINFTGLWESLQPYMERQLGTDKLSRLSLVETNNGYRIRYKSEAVTVANRGAAALVFNGPSLMEYGELKEVLSRLFPLPFPYTQNLNFV